MKNVIMSINPNAIVDIAPPPYIPNQPPAAPYIPPAQEPRKRITQVNFSAQFDTEIEAQEFAIMLLTHSKDNA